MVERIRSNTGAALEELRAQIFTGVLVPGKNYLEKDLAARLGMSRTPVREAALILQSQGLVEVQPRRGVRISAVDSEDVRQIDEVLTELECLATRSIAANKPSKNDLKKLHHFLSEMQNALEAQNREAWAQNDDGFHMELATLSGNTHLVQAILKFQDQVRRVRNLTLHLRESPVRSVADHTELVNALEAGDPDRAVKLHRDHRLRSRAMIQGLINSMLDAED